MIFKILICITFINSKLTYQTNRREIHLNIFIWINNARVLGVFNQMLNMNWTDNVVYSGYIPLSLPCLLSPSTTHSRKLPKHPKD